VSQFRRGQKVRLKFERDGIIDSKDAEVVYADDKVCLAASTTGASYWIFLAPGAVHPFDKVYTDWRDDRAQLWRIDE